MATVRAGDATGEPLKLKMARGTGTVEAGRAVIGKPGQPRTFPDGNWQFYPGWNVEGDAALSEKDGTDFRLAFKLTIDHPVVSFPDYDMGCHLRYTAAPLFLYHAGVYLRHESDTSHYRVLFSTVSKDVALYKEDVGFLAAAPAAIEEGKPFAVEIEAAANRIVVRIDGETKLDYADQKHPILKGKVGFLAIDSRATFTDVSLAPAKAAKPVSAPHEPRLAFREWHRWGWVFDGNEPVARVMRYDFDHASNGPGDTNGPWRQMGVADAKFRPGTRPLMMWPLDWECRINVGVGKTAPTRKLTRFEATATSPSALTIAYEITDDRVGGYAGRGTVDVTYDPTNDVYAYDVHNSCLTVEARQDAVEFTDPWPYGACGPAATLPHPWKRTMDYCVLKRPDDRLVKVPLTHPWAGGDALKDGGFCLFGLREDVNPVFEVFSEAGYPLRIGFCNWGLDMHTQYLVPPEKRPLPKGTEVKCHYRVLSYPYAKAKGIFDQAEMSPMYVQLAQAGLYLVNSGHDVNRLDPSRWVKATDVFDAWLWEGVTEKNWDKTVGHDDKFSLKMDGPGTFATRYGSGDFYGPFLAREYEFSAFVKTENLEGKFVLGAKVGSDYVSEPVTGTKDWTRVSVKFPGRPFTGVRLRLTVEGKGTAWVDDLKIAPVAEP